MSWKIAVLLPLPEDLVRGLFASLDAELVFPATRDQAGLHAALAEADVVVGDFTGELAMDASAVASAPSLAFVQMPQVGVDSCDMDALTAAGVVVANTAGANTRGVAEWAVGAAFAMCRRFAWADRRMREGEWPQLEIGGRELHAQRVGILGYGAIGAEAARMFRAIGCQVSYWTRTPREDAGYRQLDDLLANSDVLVVALPLTPETSGLLDASKLALLPANALLINVARGGIAPDEAVLEALESGQLAGAALDVFDSEPLGKDHPLRVHENVMLSPHAAGATTQAQFNIISTVLANLTAVVEGHAVSHVVNGLSPLIQRRSPASSG